MQSLIISILLFIIVHKLHMSNAMVMVIVVIYPHTLEAHITISTYLQDQS